MNHILTMALCAAVALCIFSSTSAAQPDKPTPTKVDIAKAKNHYHRAQSYKRLGEYESAAAEFLEAYELYQDAEFYFNAGEMYRLAGDNRRAVEYFEKYLMAHPDGRVSQAARSSVQELTSEIDAAPADRRAQRTEAEPRRGQESGVERAAAPAPPEQVASDHEPSPRASAAEVTEDGNEDDERRTQPRAPKGNSLKIAGLTSGAVGVLAIAFGAKYTLDASAASDDLSVKYDPRTEKDGHAAENKMFVFYGIGAAALIAGGALYYFGHERDARAERRRAISIAPQLAGDRVTLCIQGSF